MHETHPIAVKQKTDTTSDDQQEALVVPVENK